MEFVLCSTTRGSKCNADSARAPKSLQIFVDKERLPMFPDVSAWNGDNGQGGRKGTEVGDHKGAKRGVSGTGMVLTQGLEVYSEADRPSLLIGGYAEYAGNHFVRGITSVGGDDEGRMGARAGPLLYNVAFIAFEDPAAVEDNGGRVFLEVSTQVTTGSGDMKSLLT